ncbi:TrkA C-terminal domain-containing protein [Desulfobacterales bacterium HSG17]|nr:TrkA C-terminal domain-containing protein [Desulfobacterales bacterium HSG17]
MDLLKYLPFIKGYSIIQLPPPKIFINKTLRELNLINQFGVQVVAIEEKFPKRLNVIPTATFKLKESDTMIILGPNEALDKLKNEDF